MKRREILHIVRRSDPLALAIIQSEAAAHFVKVILIHQATMEPLPNFKIPVCRLTTPEGPRPTDPAIGYEEMLDEILAADQVVVW
jgi:hypothetical protein